MTKIKTRSGKMLLTVILIVVGAIVLMGTCLSSSYNNLVTLRGGIDNAWSNVQVQYQRRADLVPQLVSTVKGAANFEQETLTAVTEARTKWLGSQQSGDISQEIDAANQFDSAMSRLLVTVESYPTLKATENFQALQAQLEGTENRISVSRKQFNDIVLPYNIRVKRFPTVFIANMFGFDPQPFFEANQKAQDAPVVNFQQ